MPETPLSGLPSTSPVSTNPTKTDETKTSETAKFSKSAKAFEDLKQSNPWIYRLMTDDSVINNMGRSLLTNPAYTGMSPGQMQQSLMFGEQLFALGLMRSPIAQNLYMQSLQSTLLAQGTNGPLARGQMNGPFGLPGFSGLDVMNYAFTKNQTRNFLGSGTDQTKINDFLRQINTSSQNPLNRR